MSLDKTAMNEFLKALQRSLSQAVVVVGAGRQEVVRARLMKRLAFIIFAGDEDQYVPILPVIQERIVDALKLRDSPKVHEEVRRSTAAVCFAQPAVDHSHLWILVC